MGAIAYLGWLGDGGLISAPSVVRLSRVRKNLRDSA